MGFESSEGCTVRLQCSFPAEEEKNERRDPKQTVRFASKNMIMEKFHKQVQSILEQMDGNEGKYEDFLDKLKARQQKLKKLNRVECSTNYIRDNILVAQHIKLYEAELNQNR